MVSVLEKQRSFKQGEDGNWLECRSCSNWLLNYIAAQNMRSACQKHEWCLYLKRFIFAGMSGREDAFIIVHYH
jgi:hypothetical protein